MGFASQPLSQAQLLLHHRKPLMRKVIEISVSRSTNSYYFLRTATLIHTKQLTYCLDLKLILTFVFVCFFFFQYLTKKDRWKPDRQQEVRAREKDASPAPHPHPHNLSLLFLPVHKYPHGWIEDLENQVLCFKTPHK